MKHIMILILIVVMFAIPIFSQNQPTRKLQFLITVESKNYATDLYRFCTQGYEIAWTNSEKRLIDMVVTADQLQLFQIPDRSYTVVRCIPQTSFEMIEGTAGYKNSTQLESILQNMVEKYPDITHLFSIGQTFGAKNIWCLKISDHPEQIEDETSIFFVGAHHARELMSIEAVLDIAERVLEGYTNQVPEYVEWVQKYQILLVPMVNPDGVDYVFERDNWWRKNRRPDLNGKDFGVDLNRNYSYKWGVNDQGSSSNPADAAYRGMHEFSEEESRAMLKLAIQYRPSFALSFHSYGEVVLYPYGCEVCKNPEGECVIQVAQELASKIVCDSGSNHYDCRGQLYPVNGLDRDWYYHDLGTFGFVVEISNRIQGFQPDYARWRERTITGLRTGWQYILQRASGPMIVGYVCSAQTGEAIPAKVSLAEVIFQEGEIRRCDPKFGRFQWIVQPGGYVVEVSYPGYETQRIAVNVGSIPEKISVELYPTNR